MAKDNSFWFILGGLALILMAAGKALGYAVKPGVLVPTTPEMDYAGEVVARVWAAHGFRPTLTSGLDGEHREDSLHYSGLATDWRTKDLPDLNTKNQLAREVRSILGTDYDVLLEYVGQPNEHLHVEYDPT